MRSCENTTHSGLELFYLRILLGFAIVACPTALFAESVYQRSPFRLEDNPTSFSLECKNPEIKDLRQIDSEFALSETLNQGATGTCYGHAAYYLLQYLSNQDHSKAQDQLSLLDVLGKGCGRRFENGGIPYAVLHNLRKEKTIEVLSSQNYKEPSVQKVFEFDEWYKERDRTYVEICERAKSLLGPEVEGIQEAVTECLKDPKSFTHQLIRKTANSRAKDLPSYNIHVLEAGKENQDELMNRIDHILSDSPPVPLILSFKSDPSQLHSVVVLASRVLCCDHTDSKKCQKEWKIQNSYGESANEQGWFLTENLADATESITYIKACGGPDANCDPTILGQNSILYLATVGDTEELKQHLMVNSNVNQAMSDGTTPLYVAAYKGQKDVVQLLLDHHANVNQAASNGQTPLFVAVEIGHKDVIQLLLDHHANVNQARSDGMTPLYVAAYKGQKDVVQILLDHHANVNQAALDGATPLFMAAQNGHKDVVQILLDHHAKLNQARSDGVTPLYVAANKGHKDVIQILLDHHANVNQARPDGGTPLYVAAYKGHKDVIQILLDHHANVNQARSDGVTPLYVAAYDGHKDVIQLLLDHHANVNQARSDGSTPLYVAAQNGHKDVVQLLLDHHANVNQAALDGATPLFMAAQNGHKDVAQLLLDHHANVNQARLDGVTPLHIAAYNGFADIVDLMIFHKGAFGAKNNNSETPAYWAAYGKKWDILKRIAENAPETLTWKNRNHRSALDITQDTLGESSEHYQELLKIVKKGSEKKYKKWFNRFFPKFCLS